MNLRSIGESAGPKKRLTPRFKITKELQDFGVVCLYTSSIWLQVKGLIHTFPLSATVEIHDPTKD